MIADELINNIIPSLKTTDTVEDALLWMDEYRVCHLPLVYEQEYLGLISENQLFDLSDQSKPIGSYRLNLDRVFSVNTQHIFDVIKNIGEKRVTVIPVLDDKENYLGLTTSVDIIESLSRIASFSEVGGILVLGIATNDYSLAQISQIVESNDAKILSSHITSSAQSSMMEVVLKVNETDLTRVIATFERFDYDVKASYHQTKFDDDLKNRFDGLMNYLKY